MASLQFHVELSLAGRVSAPFGYRDRKSVETVATGIPEIDCLAGGLPRGALTEICGPPCSGRTTVLLSALSARTAEAEVCALIDARDSFDPRSAEAAGVELQRLLWVRCRNLDQSLRAADLLIQGGGFGFIALDLGDVAPQTVRQVPLNAWFRFRRAVEDSSTVLLVVEQESNAKTCASLVLQMKQRWAQWSATAAAGAATATENLRCAHACLLDGTEMEAEMVHSRIQSINFAPTRGRTISIASARLPGAEEQDEAEQRSFTAQSMWSYLHTLPVEAQPEKETRRK
jgi:hypothetical protein